VKLLPDGRLEGDVGKEKECLPKENKGSTFSQTRQSVAGEDVKKSEGPEKKRSILSNFLGKKSSKKQIGLGVREKGGKISGGH